jgi:ABC-type lipoprotein export system ATPase subunit
MPDLVQPTGANALLELQGVTKDVALGGGRIRVLDHIDLDIAAGSFVLIAGPSGAGKSTLLQLMGGLDQPSSGTVRLAGRDLAALPDRELTALRRRGIGFVFQFFNLLPNLSTWQNIAMPLLLDGVHPRIARQVASLLGEELGLSDRLGEAASRLSGGEMQRAAVARALIQDPMLVLADEPTGHLDSANGQAVLDLLCAAVRKRQRTLVLVSHDPAAWPLADRVVRLRDGRIVGDD